MIGSNLLTNARRMEIAQLAATRALELPLLSSGFWFHSDVRDNFYYAIHLYAYCVDAELGCEWCEEQLETGRQLALNMIGNVLSLQMKEPLDPMYGHWPLNLGNDPAAAKPNLLTVELMGCLLILFYNKYGSLLSTEMNHEIHVSLLHIYNSSVYRLPLNQINHHEAKHTSLKLLLGQQFNDKELLEQGLQFAKLQLQHIQRFGFKEYGSLPWHWHWIQSFTCVWEITEDSEVRKTMEALLDYLWLLRADYYLGGTWVGAHSRQWPHDTAKDNNTLLDYIQFGDFPLPCEISRLEGTALYTYQAAEDLIKHAINRVNPVEIKRIIQFAKADGLVTEEIHGYTFIDPEYAVGGIWERRTEFDNEQHRWDVTLPLTQTNAERSVNQAFFFHPSDKYKPGDDRHASPYGEVMYHKGVAVQLWKVPGDDKNALQSIIGCLPPGEWEFDNSGGYGLIEGIYLTFRLLNEFEIIEKEDRISITSPVASGWNGAVMEAISCKEAVGLGIKNLRAFITAAKEKNKVCFTDFSLAAEPIDKVALFYTTWQNDTLYFTMDSLNRCERLLNGQPLAYDDYTVC
jgi:hypothetical protein